MQPVRFESPMEFEGHRAAVSERLLLSGYRVREDGKVALASAATTLSEAQQRADELRQKEHRPVAGRTPAQLMPARKRFEG